MGDLSEHFNRPQFECHCGCGTFTINPALVSMLEIMVVFYPAMMITSGYRCPSYSVKVGGKADDAHTSGDAADLATRSGLERMTLLKSAMTVGFRRIGFGKAGNHLHLDVSRRLPQDVCWVER